MRSVGPSEPQTSRKYAKSLPGPGAWKKSRESRKSRKDFLETFFQTLGGPWEIFPDFFGVSGPEGPRDPVNGQRISNVPSLGIENLLVPLLLRGLVGLAHADTYPWHFVFALLLIITILL